MSNGVAAAAALRATVAVTVTAADVACASAGPDARALEWVRVAAHALPLLGTVSKAKRARKSGELTLNGSSLVPTNVCAAAGDEIEYTPRAAAVGAVYVAGDQSAALGEERERCGSEGDGEEEEPPDDGHDAEIRRWAAVCKRQGLRRVFENREMAVVVKPVGVHVKGRGPRTVERALLALLNPPPPPRLQHRLPVAGGSDGDSAGGAAAALPTPHAVHRLDARVGGLLLVAKTRGAEISLSAQLERHTVAKRYRAILAGRADGLASRPSVSRLDCSGSSEDENGAGERNAIAIPLELRERMREGGELLMVRGEIDGRPCATALRVVSLTRSARYEWISTVDLWPLTGRRHQLRVHMARLGLPIVGDDLYHERAGAALPPVVRGLGLFLFAVGIAFNDDAGADGSGNRRRFDIDEPPKFARFRHFCALNWRKQQQKRGLDTEGDEADRPNKMQQQGAADAGEQDGE